MRDYLVVAVGSAFGGVARYATYSLLANATGFPWGTLVVNYLGSFVIGWAAAGAPSHGTRLLVMTGICGGFTTFSAFSLDTIGLMRDGQPAKAALYAGISVAGCLAAAALAYRLRAGG